MESPSLAVELLLAAALDMDRAELLKLLILEPRRPLNERELERFSALAARRLSGEPTAYILGQREFYGRPFKVGPEVLIPRPETELLIDAAKAAFAGHSRGSFADLGTGSGCIAVTLALELGAGWRGLALDNSPTALQTARQNAESLKAAGQLDFALSDFKTFSFEPAALDLLVSNPPYVSEDEYAALEPGVREFEPKSALVPTGGRWPTGGRVPTRAAGDEDLKAVAALAEQTLKSGGLLLMEMGCTHGPPMREFFQASATWREFGIIQDLAGLDRLITARRA